MSVDKFRVLLIYPNTEMAMLVPINISQLAPCLSEAGCEVKLFDTTYYKWEDVNFEQKKVELLQLRPFSYEEKGISYKATDMREDLRRLAAEFKPQLIGITLVEDTWDLGRSLLEAVRDTAVPVVAGGVFVTFDPEAVMACPDVDYACVGEGEAAFVDLCSALAKGGDAAAIPNIWARKDGGVVRNPMRPLTDLDSLPYIDYDVFDPKRLYRPMQGKLFAMAHVELDRGCPYDCTYCEAPALRKLYQAQGCGTYLRRKGPERAIAEIKHLVRKYKAEYINFNAESFLAKPVEELREFARLYREVGLPFWCQSRPETVTEEKVRILKEMGCSNLQFGIEHGNEEFRARILNRRHSNARMLEAFRIVEKAGIAYTVNNIIGFPDETRELVFDTIRFNRQINPATMNCYMFTPYHGTALHKYCVDKGYLDRKAKVHQLLDAAPLKMDSISYRELQGLQRTFSLYARFPEEMFDQIRAAERFDAEGNAMFEKLKKMYHEKYFR